MIVPEYWSEAKRHARINGAQVTIKRFGWSDESEAAAQIHAEKRAGEAMDRAMRGDSVRRVDHKIAYNGAEGLPIREEVVERHDDIVITRNSYGALCLNTPDVLFADIDFDQTPPRGLSLTVYLPLLLAAAAIAYRYHSFMVFLGLALLSLFIAYPLVGIVHKLYNRYRGKPEQRALGVIEAYAEQYPETHLRLYRTPMGFRVLAMHKTYEPGSEEAVGLLNALKADPLYVRMCTNQHCFRARVSPKPWRIAVPRLTPRPGVWPIRDVHMAARNEWMKNYTRAAEQFSACRFIKTLGRGSSVVKTRQVQSLHDNMSRAESGLEIA